MVSRYASSSANDRVVLVSEYQSHEFAKKPDDLKKAEPPKADSRR